MNEQNIKEQPEIGALWEKPAFNNLRFFGRLDVEEMKRLIKNAETQNLDKINIIGYRNSDGETSKPNYILLESKFNKSKRETQEQE